MTFSIDNPRGLQQPPFGKYVGEKPSGEQGLIIIKGTTYSSVILIVETDIFPIFGIPFFFVVQYGSTRVLGS